jgi:hypothetical protein
LLGLLRSEPFNLSLLAASIEVTLYAHRNPLHTNRTWLQFPWTVDSLGLCPFEFQKVIEILVRSEHGLSAAIIKHLSRCENTVLQSLAWRSAAAGGGGGAGAASASTLIPLLAKAKAVGNAAQHDERPSTPMLDAVATTAFSELLSKSKTFKPLVIFFRKVYHLARIRLEDLCGKLGIGKATGVLVSSCLRRAIEVEHERLLIGRHIDQLMMASIHAGGPDLVCA